MKCQYDVLETARHLGLQKGAFCTNLSIQKLIFSLFLILVYQVRDLAWPEASRLASWPIIFVVLRFESTLNFVVNGRDNFM